MTATRTDIMAIIAEDGTLRLPAEALAVLGTCEVRLSMRGGELTVRPRPRRLDEIADPEERAQVLGQFLKAFAIAGVPPLPDDHDLRGDIYD